MTEWWAFKPVTTAFEKTKKLLLEPFNAWTWLKLMIIVFFVGSGSGNISSRVGNIGNYNIDSSDSAAIERSIESLLSDTTLLAILIGLVVLVLVIALLFAYLRNVFSFVFIKALASGDVHVIQPARENLERGFRLFIFTVVASLITVAAVLILIGIAVLVILLAVQAGANTAAGIVTLILAIGLIGLLILAMIAISVIVGLFVGFTYDFVAPMVYFKGMGIVEAWKWLWASIKRDWQQYGVYVITRWALELAVGILSMIVILPVALIFIAILVAGAILAFMSASTSIALAAIIGIALLMVLVVFIAVMMALSMPIAVYFRYYSLDVLKLIDPSSVSYTGRFAPPPAILPE